MQGRASAILQPPSSARRMGLVEGKERKGERKILVTESIHPLKMQNEFFMY
jgi:hypothetical protein